jgi:hypothetical protein
LPLFLHSCFCWCILLKLLPSHTLQEESARIKKNAAEADKIQEARQLSNAAQEFIPTAATATEVIPGNPSHAQTHILMPF